MCVLKNKMRQFMASLVLVVLVMGVCEATPAGAARRVSCTEERRNLVNASKSMVFGKLPSADCCLLLRLVRFRCVCPVITLKLAALIDVDRTISMIRGCGREIPRHFKCGSKSSLSRPPSQHVLEGH
ncbi:hypothetical protein MRB53_030794 [Persea americana]|uniref:Uncharacterized protein n=1 Tax=Persea americana TaxID=3435 RepID=A0ACC2KM75_PERAE|nr:hypothetical protein MRB53_030794 [Persea americana]